MGIRPGRPFIGTKLVCGGCAVRFYDLGRTPAHCPICGAEQAPPKPRALSGRIAARTPGAPFGRGWTTRRAPAVVEAEPADDAATPLLVADDDEDVAEEDIADDDIADDDIPGDEVDVPAVEADEH